MSGRAGQEAHSLVLAAARGAMAAASEAEKAAAMTAFLSLVDPAEFDGEDPFEQVAGGVAKLIEKLTANEAVTLAMIPKAANGATKRNALLFGGLVAMGGLEVNDLVAVDNFVTLGFEDIEEHYLKGKATWDGAKTSHKKSLGAKGSAAGTTNEQGKRVWTPDEAEANNILRDIGASWEEIVAAQTATALGTVPDPQEIAAMGYGSNVLNSQVHRELIKRRTETPQDAIRQLNGKKLHAMHCAAAEEMINNGYHVMGSRIMQISSMLYRVTIEVKHDVGYIYYWQDWFANHKLKPLPARLDTEIVALKVTGTRPDAGDVEGMLRKIQDEHELKLEQMTKETNRKMNDMESRMSQLRRNISNPEGQGGQGGGAQKRECWKCGSDQHTKWQCPHSDEEAKEIKRKRGLQARRETETPEVEAAKAETPS